MSLTSRLLLSRTRIDRDAASRKIPGFLDQVMSDTTTRTVLIWRGEALMAQGADHRLELVPPESVPSGSELIYLGRTLEAVRGIPEGSRIVAAVLTDETGTQVASDMGRWMSARTMAHALDDLDSGIVIEALAMANWHAAHAFSPLTGAPAKADQAGWTRIDQATGKDLFPRTDAAVIALVTDQHDRIVLGSNALWESRRYSLLAGFVEPGESLEAAVVREVFEESGLVVTHPRYMGSQPWPFPASLMVGFRAEIDEASKDNLTPDGTEIVDLRWFTRDELRASLGEVLLPGRPSIARAMIEDWLGHELPEGA